MNYMDGGRRNSLGPHKNKRIKIESGEQFVPLYLATITLDQQHQGGISIPNERSGTTTLYLRNSVSETGLRSIAPETRKTYYKKVEEQLKTELTNPVVKEYACDFKEGIQESALYAMIPVLFGAQGTTVKPEGDAYYQVRVGCYVSLKPQFYYTQKTNKYKFEKLAIPSRVEPLCVTLVKAKHLALVRAGLKLRQSISLPYPDIQILVATNASNDRHYRDLIAPIVHENPDIKVTYAASKELMKYLVLETNSGRDAIEALAKAKAAVEQPAVEPCI